MFVIVIGMNEPFDCFSRNRILTYLLLLLFFGEFYLLGRINDKFLGLKYSTMDMQVFVDPTQRFGLYKRRFMILSFGFAIERSNVHLSVKSMIAEWSES